MKIIFPYLMASCLFVNSQLWAADAFLYQEPLGTPSPWPAAVATWQYVGIRFQVDKPVNVTSLHTVMGDSPSSFFAALVSLPTISSLPQGNPFTDAEVVYSTVFYLDWDFLKPRDIPFNVKVRPGDYAIIFGAGQFGSGGYISGVISSYYSVSNSTGFAWVPESSPPWHDTGLTWEVSVVGSFIPPSPPQITCAAPMALECTNGGAIGTMTATVQDTNGNPLVIVWTVDSIPYQTNNIPSGGNITVSNLMFTANFAFGEHIVEVSASNGQTNPATCSTLITVHDTIPPQILNVEATPSLLWPPNSLMVPVSLNVNAVDSCDVSPIVRIIQITSNEPQNPHLPDWEITGAQSLNLRAERLGQGRGRIYTIILECKDASGNASSASVDVTVPHSNK